MNTALRQLIADNPGADDAAIKDLGDADPRTVRPISLSALRALLTLTNDAYGKLFRAALTSDQAANAYAFVSSGEEIHSQFPVEAAKLDSLMSLLRAAGTINDAIVTKAAELGGGYVVRGKTVEQIAAERAEIDAEALAEANRVKRAELGQWIVAWSDAVFAAFDDFAAGNRAEPTRAELKGLLDAGEGA